MQRGNFIAGGWRRGARILPVTNPYSGADVGELHLASRMDIDDAIGSAVDAFKVLRNQPVFERADMLHRLHTGLEQRSEDFARCMAREAGKPIVYARAEVARALTVLVLAAEEARRYGGESMPLDVASGAARGLGITRRYPIGPVTAITPFNFPLNLGLHKVGPALAVGSSVIWKSPPQAPGSAALFGEVAEQAGLPPGAVNILSAENDCAELLVTDERVGVVSFTGSAIVGWRLRSLVGHKRVTLELGGNAAAIVDAHTDLQAAANRCAFGAFAYQGQVCISVQRILVERAIYAPFLDKLVEASSTLRTGDPELEDTRFGPMINAEQADRVEQWVAQAVQAGAHEALPLHRANLVVSPTILTDTHPAMLVESDEVFGPVVTVNPFDTWDEAICRVNASKYGLQAGVFTPDISRAMQAFDQLEVGAVILNDVPTFRTDNMPYGGVKQSGLGREGVKYAMDELSEIKLLALAL